VSEHRINEPLTVTGPRSVPSPALVTVHVWGVPTRAVPSAVAAMASDRRRLRATEGLSFFKLLGTGGGRTFTPRDADPHHWAVLASWDSVAAADAFEHSDVVRAWDRRGYEGLRISMKPLASKGYWAGQKPFGDPSPSAHDGPVAAITRGRIKPARWPTFWRSVAPVTAELRRSPGLLLAIGIGEAPIGLQGTLSLWESSTEVNQFVHRTAAHREVIQRTEQLNWYAEELFARFAIVSVRGQHRGREVAAPALDQ
jgi:heme-degrading monooxygenase HmoA